MLIIIVIIVTTKTNGVSFSLVAGACCLVKFTSTAIGTFSSSIAGGTLNINSTGAKSMKAITNTYASTRNINLYPTDRCIMVAYNNSVYSCISAVQYFYTDD